MRSGPISFGDHTQSGPISFKDRTQSGLEYKNRTVGPYFSPVPKFETGLLTNQSGLVQSQSYGPVQSVYSQI